jgi:hypothetical protein
MAGAFRIHGRNCRVGSGPLQRRSR